MFRVSLADLQRKGSLRIERVIPEDDPLWADTELALGGPVHVDLTISRTATGQLLALGKVDVELHSECRRCLEGVDLRLEYPLELLWSAPDQLSDEPDADDEVRPLDPGAVELELGEAIREELVLAAPQYVVCDESCRGLCPHCGTNLNEAQCECVTDEPDPRWDALRALNKK